MKRMLSAVLIALLLLPLCLTTYAEETKPQTFTSGDYTYILLDDGTVEITEYNGKNEQLTISERLDGYTVSRIGDESFSWDSSLTSIILPNSVTCIGAFAFSGCSSLTSIILSDNLTSIGDCAFSICSSLTSITFPDSIIHIGKSPFIGSGLEKFNVSPDHRYLATIDGVLFSKSDKRLIYYPCAKQESIYQIPNGIQIIGHSAFHSNTCLISISIPTSVTSIEDAAFCNCSSLTSISIPINVTSIGNCAFSDCFSLTSVIIPNSVTKIGMEAFYGCSSLTSITIPDSVTSIEDWAFSGCDSLTLTVGRNSYAAQYCKENGLNYTYPDSLDWLNN